MVEPGGALAFLMLGTFEVRREGQPLSGPAWRSRQNRTLLRVLLTFRDSVVSADQLIEILWPDSNPDRARRSLYVRVSQLRRALNPHDPAAYILTVEDGYTWNPEADCWIDVPAFEATLRQARRHLEQGALPQAIAAFEAARGLYRGDFLADTPYEDFALAERERLREEALTALTELAEAYAQQGRYRRALALCQQGLAVDPSRESLYARMMLYHYYAGERTQALVAFERCRAVLDRELGVAPLPETEAVAAQIREGTLWQHPQTPRYPPPAYEGRLFEVPYSLGTAPFVGREREYAWLVAQWRAGTGAVVLIEGEAGVGKSRLVEEFLGYAAGEGARVLRASAGRGEHLPYAPLLGALRACIEARPPSADLTPATRAALNELLPELAEGAGTLPVLPELSAREAQARLAAALVSLIALCVPAGAILFFDDAHRADRSTLALLPALPPDLTVVLTTRSEEAPADHPLRHALHPLQRVGRLATLSLGPLAPDAVAGLVCQLAGEALPELAEWVTARAQGNPLFILASVQWMFEQGELYVDPAGRWRLTHTPTEAAPPTVRAVIEERLRRLARTPRRLFDLMAVIGGDADFALLRQAAQLEEGPALDALDVLLDARLIVEPRAAGRGEFAPAHDRYVEVAYATLPTVRRRQLHRLAAEGLAATAGDPDAVAPAVAQHFERAQDAVAAFPWLVRAGDAAARRYAYDDAVAFYRRAIDDAGGEVGPVYERLGRIAHHAARYEDGVAAYGRALDYWQASGDAEAQARVRLGLAECHREMSAFGAAVGHARAALETAEALVERPDLVARAHVVLSNAFRTGQLAPPTTIRAHLEEAGALAERAQEWQTVGEAHFWLGVVTVNGGDAARAVDHDRAALARFRQTGDAGWQAIALNNLAYHCLLAGRSTEALAAAQEGVSLARAVGARNSEGWLLSTLGEIQLHLGQLEVARAMLEEGLAFVEAWGPPRLRPGFQHDLARVAIAREDWSGAEALLSAAIAGAAETAPQFVPRLRIALAEAHLGAGDAAQALDEACAGRAAAAAKQQRSVEGRAWRIVAEAQARLGDGAAAEAAFERSLDLLEGVGDALEAARTCAAWGEALRGCDDGRAAALLDAARGTFVRCQAEVDLQRWTS